MVKPVSTGHKFGRSANAQKPSPGEGAGHALDADGSAKSTNYPMVTRGPAAKPGSPAGVPDPSVINRGYTVVQAGTEPRNVTWGIRDFAGAPDALSVLDQGNTVSFERGTDTDE